MEKVSVWVYPGLGKRSIYKGGKKIQASASLCRIPGATSYFLKYFQDYYIKLQMQDEMSLLN